MIDPARLAGKDVQRLRNILSQSGTGAASGGFGTPEQGEHRGINEQ
jgi:hypothetical protein